MGWLAAAAQVARDMFTLPAPVTTLAIEPAHTFDTAPRPVDQVIAEMMRTGTGARVSRGEALSVAAVKRGRNELCSIATLPLRLYRGLDIIPSALLRQIDPDVPNLITLAATIEDLAFEGIAWWQVTGLDFDGFPISARHVAVDRVSLHPPSGKGSTAVTPAGYTTPDRQGSQVWVDGEPVPAAQMKRFDSPNPGLLKSDARVIRRALLLDQLAQMFAENPQLREYFTDADDLDTDPMDDDEIDKFLADYMGMRRVRPVGWIPSTVKRADVSTPSPVDLQLVQLQQQVTLEIANGLGVDPEDLGMSTTSRTYFNASDRAQQRINRTLAPYMQAITQRLSMGDITRHGHEVRFDPTQWLASDPMAQAQYWEAMQRMGAMDAAEIRTAAGLSGPPPTPAPAPPAQLPAGSDRRPAIQLGDITPRRGFDDRPAMTFAVAEFAEAPPAPTVDTAARTITGLALPYNAIARKFGIAYRFRPGSLEYGEASRVKHLMDHGVPVGSALKLTDSPDGLTAELGVLSGPEGSARKLERDQLLYDAENGLYDGLSVGVDFSMFPEDGDVEFNEDDQVYDVVRATLREISSTPLPAFDDARVTKVAASRTGGTHMKCPHCGQPHGPGIACQTYATQLALSQPTPAPAPAPTPGAPEPTPAPTPADPPTLPPAPAGFSWSANPQTGSYMLVPASVPAVVNPHHGPAQVTEPEPYVFDARGWLTDGAHSFAADLVAAAKHNDGAARDRLSGFIGKVFSDPTERARQIRLAAQDSAQGRGQFAVTPANVAGLNPTRQRPDMYVDQMEFNYPIWNAIEKGPLTDVTPFTAPKFSSASGLVGDHTTGTEPTPGAFAVTTQTITPTPVSGKLEVVREALDQIGSPQMTGLLWRQMVRAYYESLEAFAQAQLVAAAASIPDIVITTGAADAVLDAALSAAIVPLQYIRGGNRFRRVFTQIDLFKAMAAAKDSTGRRLYPMIGAQNANGTTESGYSAIDAHGMLWLPAWATAASGSVAASSWAFDPDKVCGWASAPSRLDIEWRVAWVDIGIWGYKAFAITDFAGTREFVYDPVV